jgi:hypothetical protein
MRAKSQFFKIEFGDFNPLQVEFLDVKAFKGPGWVQCGHLDITLFHKPTSQYQPLAKSSTHPRHVHLHWPHTLVDRIERLVKSPSLRNHELKLLSCSLGSRLGFAYVDELISRKNVSSLRPRVQGGSVLVLPFFEQLEYAAIGRILMDVHSRHLIAVDGALVNPNACTLFSHVRLAYKLAYPRLHQRLKKLNGIVHEDAHRWSIEHIGGV